MPEGEQKAFIREVILENFMSYDYGRIPLRAGLNVVLGPNGAGKSSILLGISVALGQAYTERSRRLSDLVKRGKEISRVTLLLNNTPRDGKRPLPFRSDLIHLSRYIRKDGTYWFEIDFKEASKLEVTETLSKLGLNPDNMLVIMHQGLGDAFSLVSPQEKLSMVEDAVGLAPYRRSLLEAKQRLEQVRTEQEEREKELEEANVGLGRWKEQYERFLRLKELRKRLSELAVEEGWAKVLKAEYAISNVEEKLLKVKSELEALRRRVEEQLGASEAAMKILERRLEEYGSSERTRLKLDLERRLPPFVTRLLSQPGQGELSGGSVDAEIKALLGADSAIEEGDSRVASTLVKFRESLEKLLESREELAVSRYRVAEDERELRHLQKQRAELDDELKTLSAVAGAAGSRPENVRQLSEVLTEERVVELQLKEMGDIPTDVEAMYNDFRQKIEGLKARLEELHKNKEATLREVQERFSVWKREVESLVSDLSRRFDQVLSMVGGSGRVSLVSPDDPLAAGLEILVSFRGDQLVPLDSYVQSGGERSSAVAALLLSLQGRVVSPFRAVDEFDVHMDKLNRQLFMKSVYEMFRKAGGEQYLVITPVEPEVYDTSANYIMVNKVASSSRVGEVARVAASK
jgi:chromosome segregation ATPase